MTSVDFRLRNRGDGRELLTKRTLINVFTPCCSGP